MAETSLPSTPAASDEIAEPTLDGAFSPDGVDLTLIRWMLERSPAERLAAAQGFVDSVAALRPRRALDAD